MTKATTKKMTKSTFERFAAVPATPVKPKAAAISATTKNINAQVNMVRPLAYGIPH